MAASRSLTKNVLNENTCNGKTSRTAMNKPNIIVELLAKGTLLFILTTGTVLYRSGPSLLCGTVPCGTVLLGKVPLLSEHVQTGKEPF